MSLMSCIPSRTKQAIDLPRRTTRSSSSEFLSLLCFQASTGCLDSSTKVTAVPPSIFSPVLRRSRTPIGATLTRLRLRTTNYGIDAALRSLKLDDQGTPDAVLHLASESKTQSRGITGLNEIAVETAAEKKLRMSLRDGLPGCMASDAALMVLATFSWLRRLRI